MFFKKNKSAARQQAKREKRKNEFITIIIISVLLGLTGGIAGQIFAGSYFALSSYRIPYWSEINFSDGVSGGSVVISGARKVVVEQDMKITETINSSSINIVGIFRKKENFDVDNENFILDRYYNLNEKRGQGIIITSDGWIMTSAFSPSVRSDEEILNEYVIISQEGKIFEIDKVLRNPLMDFGFVHIVDAKNLNAIEFVDFGEIKIGQQILAINWEGESVSTSIIGENGVSRELIKDSDYYNRTFKVANELPASFNGGFIFDLEGRLMSVLNNKGEIKSVNNLRSAVKSVLTEEKIKRGGLGISYVNLQDLAFPGEEQKKGALIYEIKYKSVAQEAGLKEGDIITFVNNFEINKKNELNYVLQNYMAGEKVSFTYIRDDEKHQIDVVLGEY